jgi:hypothetical protein
MSQWSDGRPRPSIPSQTRERSVNATRKTADFIIHRSNCGH